MASICMVSAGLNVHSEPPAEFGPLLFPGCGFSSGVTLEGNSAGKPSITSTAVFRVPRHAVHIPRVATSNRSELISLISHASAE